MFSSVQLAFFRAVFDPINDGEMSMTDELVKKRWGGKPKEPPFGHGCWVAVFFLKYSEIRLNIVKDRSILKSFNIMT